MMEPTTDVIAPSNPQLHTAAIGPDLVMGESEGGKQWTAPALPRPLDGQGGKGMVVALVPTWCRPTTR